MTDSKPVASTNDLGVVDPIRIPGAARVRRLWARLPLLSRVFVALAAVDVVVRGLGLFGTSLFLEIDQPLTWLTAFLPHDALILLPAVIVARRPTVLVELPLILRGAMTIALLELLKRPVEAVARQIGGDQILLPVLVAVAAAAAIAAGWIAIAQGIRSFTPRKPSESVAGLANLVAGGFAIGVVAAAVSTIMFVNVDVGDPGWSALVRLSNLVASLSGLGLAYLGWVVVRGTGDPDRPAAARKLATISLAGLAAGGVLLLFVGQGLLWIALILITHVFAYTGLVVAFGLGLADPSRNAAEAETEPADGPSWPEAGDPSSWPQPEHRPSP